MIILRPTIDDADRISECIRESSTLSRMTDGSEEGIADWMALSSVAEIRDRVASLERNLLAEEDDTVVGYISFRRTNHLSLLFVREGFKRRGIGRQLFQQAATGLAEVTLNSSDDALQFYSALGFLETGKRFHLNGAWSTPMKWQASAQQDGEPDAPTQRQLL